MQARQFQIVVIVFLIQTCHLFAQTEDFASPITMDTLFNSYDISKAFLLKGFSIKMDEYRLKSSLIRLVRYSKAEPLNRYEPLELFAWRMETNTPQQKNAIMGYVFAGAVAQQGLKTSRKLLSKLGIRNIYPNLTGLHAKYPINVLNSGLFASLYPNGRAISLNMIDNAFTIRLYKTRYYISTDSYFKLYKHNRFMFSQIQYSNKTMNSFGYSHYQHNFYIIFKYSLDFSQTKSGRMNFCISWTI